MSIFGNIMNAIFGRAKASEQNSAATPAETSAQAGSSAGGASSPSIVPGASASGKSVDVEAVLSELASKNSQKLDWKRSIVDLMKLLNLDSSIAARKQLAKELNYTGSTDDSAAMNIWLHKQVMKKLAENGGKVPAELH
jgi:hypothetical protein